MQPNVVEVLADTASRAGDIDEAAALEAKQRAEAALSDKGTEFDYTAAATQLAEAAAQLRTIQQLKRQAKR